ncbi:MAG: hypothetical protein IPN14_11805 [Bacteroidetes bacterium]|nr:hypothetical protein [Bacteroidota bacterium]
MNCDSSWLTFENRNSKVVLYSFDSTTIEMTQKVGIDYETHYPGLILLRNRLISGCCTPSEFILLNDVNADTINYLGRILYHSTGIRNPFILKYRFQDYDHYENNDGFDFTLEILDLSTGKSNYSTKYSKQLRDYYLQSGMIYPEELFNDIGIESDKLIVTIRHRINDEWKTTKMILPK